MTRDELLRSCTRIENILNALLSNLNDFHNHPQYDEDYKLEWFPTLTQEHFDRVELCALKLNTEFDRWFSIDKMKVRG